MKIHVNGSLDSNAYNETTTRPSVNQNLAIGANGSNNTYNFNGGIDQVRIFDKALNIGEINSLYNETTTTAALGTISNPSTVAYYKMQDATDETGSYNGTTVNNVDFNVAGKYGFAGKFNGTNSYITTGLTWPGGTQLSWSGWIKTSNTKNTYVFGDFASGGANSSHRLSVRIYSQNFQATINNAGGGLGTTVTFGTFAHYGEWAHLVVTIDGTTLKGYVNGSQLGSAQTSSESLAAGANPFVFGNYGPDTGASQQFDGRIDQVRIFNKAISAAEVTKLYNEIQCANTITTPESYFNTVTYPGASSSVSNVGFQPDLLWIKGRTFASNNRLFDSVRGASAGSLRSNGTQTQETGSGQTITSLDSGGFTAPVVNGDINQSGQTFVAWNWKAASSNTTNNDGSTPSTVRASQESGFSIVQHTAPASGYYTVGHGLNKKPSLVITKSATTAGYSWYTWASALSDEAKSYLALDLNMGDGISNNYNMWAASGSGFTSTTFGHRIGYSAGANSTQIAYCFANVDGYQRIGSYFGNGSANGPFVFTGFEPAWLMIKRIDAAGEWNIFDNKRDTENPRDITLWAQDYSTESTASQSGVYDVDFFTNGFQIKNSYNPFNNSSGTYLFMAIAANPDTTAPTKANSFKTKIYTGNGTNKSISTLNFAPDLVLALIHI